MKKKSVNGKMQGILVVFVGLFVLLGSYLMYTTVAHGEEWFTRPYNPRISAAKNIADAGDILDRTGTRLAWSEGDERRYAESENMRRAVSHVVGDVYGMSVGAETYFAKYLYGYDQNAIDKLSGAVAGADKKGGDVYLTIDAGLCEYIYDRMDYNGAVVLMNYQTGEILASVSTPSFDPYTIKNGDDDTTGSKYFDRATQGKYPPGSTMKVVTTAAALEQGLTGLEIDCTGEKIIEGQKITCPKQGGHGHVNFNTAFEKSCNIYYAELSVLLGQGNLLNTANSFAFNTSFNFSDFNLTTSNFEVSDNMGDLAWAGIGQYLDTVSPMHNMLISAGIANGGTAVQPRTLLDVAYNGNRTMTLTPSTFKQFTSAEVAAQVKELMRATVDHGTATSAQVGGVTVCGKTGTAEYYDSEAGGNKNHSWFVGFVEDASHPLAIAVLQEGAGFGSAVATPLAGQVLSRAIEMGY